LTLLLDTGPFAFLLMGSVRMNDELRDRIVTEDTVLVSAISFFEVGQKVRIGKWPEMEPYVADLEQRSRDDGFEIVSLTGHLAMKSALLDWDHRDPFDRMIAATALQEGVPVVSSDAAFDRIGVRRVW
jgi:PIN domain nuclease of toxin-antitoxin system